MRPRPHTPCALLVAMLGLVACGDPQPPDVLQVGACDRAIFYTHTGPADTIAVVGAFTDWGFAAVPMQDPDGDGVYVAVVSPPPGRHQYRIYVDGDTFIDPFNPLTAYAPDGVENSVLEMPDCATPRLEGMDADGLRLRFVASRSQSPLEPSSVRATTDGGLEVPTSTTGNEISLDLSTLPDGKHWIEVTAADRRGLVASPLRFPRWVEARRFEWRDATIYQVFIDRFRRGQGTLDADAGPAFYHGGDLHGVREALEEGYFDALGVNVLWLSPVYENPEGVVLGRNGFMSEAYHGYWPTDPYGVETRFGGAEALHAVVDAAHARGIRVLLDIVLNHVHQTHPYWSERPGDPIWFNRPDGDCVCGTTCPWGPNTRECWFEPFLPDLTWTDDALVEQVVADAVWWIDTFDVDGFRLDAVPMMPRLSLRQLRAEIDARYQQGGEHIYLVGETYSFRGDQSLLAWYLGDHTLSGQFDFPVMWALRDVLAGRLPMDALEAEVEAGEPVWQDAGAVMAPFLGNHDVPRFVTDLNGDPMWSPLTAPAPIPERDLPYQQLRTAWTFVMGQPGAPVIYYGDEIGLEGANDPDNRRNMLFGDALAPRQAETLAHVRRLGRVRDCSAALRRGDRETLQVGINTYAWGRDAGDGYPAIGVINRRVVDEVLTLTLPESWVTATDLTWVDVHTGTAYPVSNGAVEVSVAGYDSVLLVDARCAPAE